MRIGVDRKRCEGYGMCEKAAPELFELDQAGELIVKYEGREIPAEYEEAGREAVRVCPVAALFVEKES